LSASASSDRSAPIDLRALYGDRVRLAVALLAPVIVLGLALRPILYVTFHSGAFDALALLASLAAGVLFDALAALIAFGPVLIGLALFRWRFLARPAVRATLLTALYTALCFNVAVEYFFFEEFNARFNNIAVDYVLYPYEVVGNVWQSYNVPLFLVLSLACGIALCFAAMRWLRGVQFGPLPWRARWRAGSIALASIALACVATIAVPSEISSDRIVSEVAQNGLAQLVRAFQSAGLDFPLYYRTLPTPVARERAAGVLGFAPPSADALAADAERFALQKKLVPQAITRPAQVVVILEESLGSEFVGALGATARAATPNLDRWCPDGLLLTNLVANGNRTVRGLEGVLCSFAPLPGDSIVKRDKSENVASVARVMSAAGYRTAFFYGGYGVFDEMKPFMSANGWQDFVEQPDYPDDAFRTIWGVADEYIFDAMIARQLAQRDKGEPFFGTLMSVSNHKPYTFPEGRVHPTPQQHGRLGAVLYADYCIGRYLDQLREKGLLDSTLVLIVGDHGARVYGAEAIPTESYRIPALFITPDARWHGRRIERLCSQVDLLPTLLSLAGIATTAPFFGSDLLGAPPDGGRAFVHHNRDVGILTDRALAVLGLRMAVTYYTRSGRDSDVFELASDARVTPELRALADDASAVFGTAYELYEARRFRLPADLDAANGGAHDEGLEEK
jgi:phosphoglycerol transferase MdoB-like AlkP superfamily enzyme